VNVNAIMLLKNSVFPSDISLIKYSLTRIKVFPVPADALIILNIKI
jgi:hypothetical protein